MNVFLSMADGTCELPHAIEKFKNNCNIYKKIKPQINADERGFVAMIPVSVLIRVIRGICILLTF